MGSTSSLQGKKPNPQPKEEKQSAGSCPKKPAAKSQNPQAKPKQALATKEMRTKAQ